MVQIFSYEDLPKADLVVDAVYEGSGSQLPDEPISKLLRTGNQGGFRPLGRGKDKKFIVLYTTGEDKDWPDQLDLTTGQFLYYGDNKEPGCALNKKSGNKILEHVFDLLHLDEQDRSRIPPFFVFRKYPTTSSPRSVQFRGLAVPGFPKLPPTEDLVAIWKTLGDNRFQNYQATFTILDVPVITRAWLDDLVRGDEVKENAPDAWLKWIHTGQYSALVSENTTVGRSEEAQLPNTPDKEAILKTVWEHFEKGSKEGSRAFEFFAAHLFKMHDQRATIDEITRASVDGGRDAVGRYRLGVIDDPVYVEFALEAKCYRPALNGQRPTVVGVDGTSRLISRLRYRQFGVLVTTSVISRRAYKEVREDRHPVIFLCGKDIADILINAGFNTLKLVKNMLEKDFPVIKKKM